MQKNNPLRDRIIINKLNSASWARTNDIMINSHALCRLSYGGMSGCQSIYSKMRGNDLLSQGIRLTTIGAKKLNCCVRDGYRCDLLATITTHLRVISYSLKTEYLFQK